MKNRDDARLALDAAGVAIILVDERGIIRHANPFVHQVLGYAPSELVGRAIEVLVPESAREPHVGHRAAFAANPTRRSMGGDRLLVARRADGSEVHVEIGLAPFIGEGDPFTVATLVDVSKRREMEKSLALSAAALRMTNEGLRKANEDLEAFARSASHDLQAPLATLEGFTSLLAEELAEGKLEAARELSERLRRLAVEARERVRATLWAARAGDDSAARVHVDLAELVDTVLHTLEELRHARSVTVVTRLPDARIARVDPARLMPVLQNLVENAITYCDPEAGKRLVRIDARWEEDLLVLEVRDNGIGIPPGKQPEIFESGRRGDNHELPGTGLGLAIVRRNVLALGGRVRLESHPGSTCFRVELPGAAPS